MVSLIVTNCVCILFMCLLTITVFMNNDVYWQITKYDIF